MEMNRTNRGFTRRKFLWSASGLGAASLFGLPGVASAEPPPEVTTIRLIHDPQVSVLCFAPQYVAKQFLHMEGFTDVRYVPFMKHGGQTQTLIAGEADITAEAITDWVGHIDRKEELVVLAGLHQGCFEIFANEKVRSVRELKGKRVAVTFPGNGDQLLIASIVAYIGLDPNQDIEWVFAVPSDWAQMLANGQVDAVGAFPPMSYEIHSMKIGHVIVNTTTDLPWRDYFCCMVGARRDFVRNNPVATKRALRAILKANQLCSREPNITAQWLVNSGFAPDYAYAQRTLEDIPYDVWRTYNPEDTLRFYALRLHEVRMVKTPPNEIIARGTDWRFLNELKRELKA